GYFCGKKEGPLAWSLFHCSYLTIRLFLTACTPLTLRATLVAFGMSWACLTKPLSWTVPLNVSTLISVDFKVGSFTIAAFTLVVIHESSTYSPVPSVFEVDAQPTTAVNM